MTRDEWVVLPLKDSDEVSIVIRRSEVVAYGPTNGGFTWVTMAGSDNTYTAHMPLAEFEALLFGPAEGDDYTRAGVAYAEALTEMESATDSNSLDRRRRHGALCQAKDAFEVAYWNRYPNGRGQSR